MPRSETLVQNLLRSGSDLSTTSTDATNGNFFYWSGGPVLMSFFSASNCTVTIKSPSYVDTVLKVPDLPLVLTPGTVKLWAIQDPSYYNNGGMIEFDSSVSCSVAVYRVA